MSSGRRYSDCRSTVPRLIRHLQRKMNEAWNEVVATLQVISNVSEVRPAHGNDVFGYAMGADKVRVIVRPVTFRLTRKAAAAKADMYVTVAGWMEFHERDAESNLRSFGFKTEVGYFVERSATALEHPLGLHYDYDRRIVAHPYYHSQLCSLPEYVDDINRAYNRTFSCPAPNRPSLTHVRIPTAHMDAFSVLIQIFSDHLLNENAGQPSLAAYARTIEACSFFECDAGSVGRFDAAFDARSLRAHHWYER